jgi:hypothetical protein
MVDRRIFLASLGASFTCLVAPAARSAPRVRLAVVVAEKSPLVALSRHELRRVYSGEIVTRADGKRLIPLMLAARLPDRVGFDQAVLGMSADEVARYWIDRKIRGQSGPPKSVDSSDLLQRVVAQLDGAIGYVRSSNVRPGLKAVRIDGKTPSDPGYSVEY